VRILACAALTAALAGSVLADTTVPPAARAHLDKAEIAREEGRMEDAAGLDKQAIEAHPLYTEAHVGYLASLRAMGDFGPAAAFYERLVADHADSIELKVFQAAAAYPSEAVTALEPIAEANRDNARAWLELGRAQLALGELRDAERSLKSALKLETNLPAGHVLLGDCYLRADRFRRARRAYKSALDENAAYVPAQLRMAWAWHRAEEPEKGLKILGTLVSEDNFPNLVAAHWLLALIRADLGNYDDAVESMDRVLAIDKGDFDARMVKGYILLRQGKPTAAAQIFTEAATADPRSSAAVFALGWAHERSADAPEIQDAQRKERLVKAAEAYERCTTMDPSVRPRDSLGFVHLMSQKHSDAVVQFRRAKDIDPKFAPTLNNLGLALDIADNRSEAKKRYQAVLGKIDKENVRAMVMLALDLWLDGNANKAIKQLEKALKIREDDDLAWTFLGDIHYDAGSPSAVNRAIKCYKEAVELNPQNFYAWYHMGIAYDVDKRRYEEADRCYEKAHAINLNPPVDLLLRLAEINEEEVLDRLEKSLQYYQAYVDAGGPVDGDRDWIPERIEELKEELEK